jgi:hypothetical protein
MPDESLPPADKAVIAFLEIIAFALGWNGIDRLLAAGTRLNSIPVLAVSILISYAGSLGRESNGGCGAAHLVSFPNLGPNFYRLLI